MVFENIFAYLLERYLGDYIENLDTKRLQIDLWTGNVVLENLFLKSNALTDFHLPITISIGYLQKLTLQVPWKNLYTHPTRVFIDGVYLLIVPKTDMKYNAQRDEKERYDTKMKEVRRIEEVQKLRETQKNLLENNDDKDTFIERIELQIIRNIELTIQNIHIVYEDQSSKPTHPFAFGITLHYFTLHTTTSNWDPSILQENTSLIYKLGELTGFSIYWNSNIKPRSNLSRDDAINDLKAKIAMDDELAPSDISYILRPLHLQARIILAVKPRQENFKRPMFDIKVDLDEINLNINHNQYSDMLNLFEFQDHLILRSKYIKYHYIDANENLSSSLKNWRFAYEAIINEEIRPKYESYKWKNIKAHLERRRQYYSLHLQALTGKLTDEQKQLTEALEKQLDVFNLAYARRNAEIEAKKFKQQEPKTWWKTVSDWWNGNQFPNDAATGFDGVMSAEEKRKLYEAIGYVGEDMSTLTYPEEYVDIDLTIHLNLLDVNVWSIVNQYYEKLQVIARACIMDTNLKFKRRPAINAIAVSMDMKSLQVFGIANDASLHEFSNENRPIMVQPTPLSSMSEEELLKVEFETKPLDKKADYRLKVISQSFEIKYDAPTINKLVECFEPDPGHHLEGVKQVAYSTYVDVKHRSYILMKHNIEKIKVLDIYIDLQSSYFLLPENGIYDDGGAAICMDFGHLTLKRYTDTEDVDSEAVQPKTAQDIDEARALSYTRFKLKIEDIQLIYAHRNESWEIARKRRHTNLHLIQPVKLELEVDKCIYNDDAVLPAWRVAGNVPNIEIRLSDKRLFQIIHHLQQIPLPELKYVDYGQLRNEYEKTGMISMPSNKDSFLFYDAFPEIDSTTMTSMQSNKSNDSRQTSKDELKNFKEGQSTQLHAEFTLEKLDLHICEELNQLERDQSDEPFLHLTLHSIIAKIRLKTFDMEFNASLTDLVLYHEQFIGRDDRQLCLLSTYVDKKNDTCTSRPIRNFVTIHFLHTSSNNPLFLSSFYNGIENKAFIHFTKLFVTLQLEALLSILRFQDTLLKKLSEGSSNDNSKAKQIKTQEQHQARSENSRSFIQRLSTVYGKELKKTEFSTAPTLKVKADFEELGIVISSKARQLFNIAVQGVKTYVSQSSTETLIDLVLSDLSVFDPDENARYHQIISQHADRKQLLRVNISLFNHDEQHEKPIEACDCDINIQFAKANIIFLFKYIDTILTFLDSLNITKAAIDLSGKTTHATDGNIYQVEEKPFKVHLNVTFYAPNIIIPTNSYSDEAILFDLGKLTLVTSFYDDLNLSIIEEQNIVLENVLANRIKYGQNNRIQGATTLLRCAELNMRMNRLLYPLRHKEEPKISVKAEWELVHFQLTKDDYSCIMKVLMENFNETIDDEILEIAHREGYRYREKKRERREEDLRDEAVKRQKADYEGAIVQNIKVRAEIKSLTLTLYLGESDLTVHCAPRNERLRLASVDIGMLEVLFRQYSDSSYKAMVRVRNILLDDLREEKQSSTVKRIIDRHFTVDPSTYMLIGSFEFKPKSTPDSRPLRLTYMQLESLYVCISLSYLITLQDFFISGLPSTNPDRKTKSGNSAKVAEQRISTTRRNSTKSLRLRSKAERKLTRTSTILSRVTTNQTHPPKEDVETRFAARIKNPEIIILENEYDINSNCLVFDFVLETSLISVGKNTKARAWLKNLTAFISNFVQLKNSQDNDGKVKYRIVQPAQIDFIMVMNDEELKIDVPISDISVRIEPGVVRTLIAMVNQLGTMQVFTENQEDFDIKTLFEPRPFSDEDFWFIKDAKKDNTRHADTDQPSDYEYLLDEDNAHNAQKSIAQRLILTLNTIDVKFEVGLGSAKKPVAAMCLTKLAADIKNWSSKLSVSSSVNIEAALFNEYILCWEPLIEPTMDVTGSFFSPWCVTCTILPLSHEEIEEIKTIYKGLPFLKKRRKFLNETERVTDDAPLYPKQMIYIHAKQLLNLTITKTGLDLVMELLTLFDVYNKRSPCTDDETDDLPSLSLFNGTGQDVGISNLDGMEFAEDTTLTSIILKHNESVPLLIPNQRDSEMKGSVIEAQNSKRRQEFCLTLGDCVKRLSINRTWKRVYDVSGSQDVDWPLQLLSDIQLKNNRRRIILSSIIKISNSTTFPLAILSIDATEAKQYRKVAKIDVNSDYHVPIDLLYAHEDASIYIALNEDDQAEIDDFFSLHWKDDVKFERKLKLKNGTQAHFIIFKEMIEAYSGTTEELDQACYTLYIHSAVHLTNLLPIDIQCTIDLKLLEKISPVLLKCDVDLQVARQEKRIKPKQNMDDNFN